MRESVVKKVARWIKLKRKDLESKSKGRRDREKERECLREGGGRDFLTRRWVIRDKTSGLLMPRLPLNPTASSRS